MYWTGGTRSINVGNNYSKLKYPLAFASVLTTILALLLLLSFRSNDWFHYELVYRETNSSTPNQPSYAQLVEFGTVGLWKLCIGHYDDPHVKCEPWTNENRPHSFNTLIVLVSCALFLANLTVFPSWAASILILYNTNNRYIRSILGFIWILVILTFSYALLLLVAILISCLSRFYAPGVFSIGSQHLFFHSGSGLYYMGFATLLALISLFLILSALIGKKVIDMRLAEAEKDLLKQLSEDNYQPGWHRMIIAPRSPISDDEQKPPPYESGKK